MAVVICGSAVIPEAGHVRCCILEPDHDHDHETIFRLQLYRWANQKDRVSRPGPSIPLTKAYDAAAGPGSPSGW